MQKAEFFNEIRSDYKAIGTNGVKILQEGSNAVIFGAHYLQWDGLHGEVEVYDINQKHMGALDPILKKIYKAAVNGRKLTI